MSLRQSTLVVYKAKQGGLLIGGCISVGSTGGLACSGLELNDGSGGVIMSDSQPPQAKNPSPRTFHDYLDGSQISSLTDGFRLIFSLYTS